MRPKALAMRMGVLALLTLTVPGIDAGERFTVSPGHNLIKESEPEGPAIDREVGPLSFKDVDGKSYYLEDLRSKGPSVFIFLSTECPLAKRYSARLGRVHKAFGPRGVSVFGVYSNGGTTREAVAEFAREWDLPFPAVKDQHGYLARALGATMTPQAFVVDRAGELRYRGAIDDHRYEGRVKRHHLREALEALLAGKPVPAARTEAHGCTLHLPTADDVETVTYAGHIARILQTHCVACHRPGQVGPFSLTDYGKARTWAKEIRAYTEAGVMPPWKAAPDFGEFANDRRLSDDELALIRRWVAGGTPRGDKADLPPAPRFHAEWALGKPDVVLQIPEEYTLGPEGEDDYRHFIIPTNFGEDRYVEAIDVRPGNAQVVHHVIAYVDTSGKARELDKADPGPGYTRFGDPGFKAASALGGWVPGRRPGRTLRGTGAWLPKGADIVLQVHYYRTGKTEKDRTRFGLYFSKSPRPIRIHAGVPINQEFTIPAGAKRHEVRAAWEVEHPVYALGATPHMHLLGREMKVTARLPGGEVLPLVWIKDWDFNWQQGYRFKKPLLLPKGTRVEVVAHYDNSAGNPNNPHSPPRPVRWGEKTTDEMCICFVPCVSAAAYDALKGKTKHPATPTP